MARWSAAWFLIPAALSVGCAGAGRHPRPNYDEAIRICAQHGWDEQRCRREAQCRDDEPRVNCAARMHIMIMVLNGEVRARVP